jgi:nicotinamide-nucleotide amidase
MPTAEILSQGDEVVTGQIADTNAAWLSDRLTELGFTVTRHTTVGDRPSDIRDAMLEIAARADVCIGTGGLGPTDDDFTTRAAAEAFGRPLFLDEEAMRQIEAMYARFQRVMPEINRRQAWIPTGALRLDNAWGTAPGFAVEHGKCWFAFVPGVPREMKPMFDERILPILRERFALRPGRLVTIRTTGIGESDMQERVRGFEHPGCVMGTRTMLPENLLKLRFSADVADDEVRAVTAELAARIGTPVFGIEGLGEPCGSLTEVVSRALAARGETISVAESCTGGRIAALFTAIPGSSGWFQEGVVAYANAAKVRILGVSEATIAEHGAVSEATCREMAEGMRSRAGTTYALAITGIAGPDGGRPDKPVGTIHAALASPSGTIHRQLKLGGDRTRIQELAAGGAIDLLRRHLQNKL